MKRPPVVLTLLLALALALPTTAGASGQDHRIFPPNSHPLGASYEHWAARFGRYLAEPPVAKNPLANPSCRNIREKHGALFFPVATAQGLRFHCDIAADTPLLVSPGGTFHTVGIDAATRRGVRRLVRQDIANTSDARVWIDGQRVRHIGRFFTGTWTKIELGDDNIFGAPAGTYDMLIKGWLVMVHGFHGGHHRVKLHDVFPDGNGNLQPATVTFVLDVD
jgi:hypothetical protein